MTLTVETGTGIQGAESYVTVAYVDAHWTARSHLSFAATWAAATTAAKEGALREVTEYLDARFSEQYRGTRKGYLQGLEWPRSGALDDKELELPAVPPQLRNVCAALAGRAIGAPLSVDADTDAVVKSSSEKVDVMGESVTYFAGASNEKKFGVVLDALKPILISSGNSNAMWNWR